MAGILVGSADGASTLRGAGAPRARFPAQRSIEIEIGVEIEERIGGVLEGWSGGMVEWWGVGARWRDQDIGNTFGSGHR